jgi:hypothetical protein
VDRVLSDRLDRIEALLALARARAAGAFAHSSPAILVFRPGGVPGPGVFTTYATLTAAAAMAPGDVFVELDDSIADADVPTGAWNQAGWIWLGTLTPTPRTGRSPTLKFQKGATLTALPLFLSLGVIFLSQSLSPVFVSAAGQSVIVLGPGSIVASDSTVAGVAPFVHVTAAGPFAVGMTGPGSKIGDGTAATITVDAGAVADLLIAAFMAQVQANALEGAGTAIGFLDAQARLGTPQAIATLNLQNTAAVQVVDGTAAAPGVAFIADSASGMYRRGGGIVGIASSLGQAEILGTLSGAQFGGLPVGTGASGATCTVQPKSTQISGHVTIVTGPAVPPNDQVGTVAFASPVASGDVKVTISPSNEAATASPCWASGLAANSFQIAAGSGGIPGATTLTFDYVVVG